MAIGAFASQNSRYFMCLANYPSQNSPTISTDDPNSELAMWAKIIKVTGVKGD
jgi:hypothetical protein